MSHEYELRRLTEKLKSLTEEQSRINKRILKSRRDEQYELEYIRRRFNNEIQRLESKQEQISTEMERRERELHVLEKRITSEEEAAANEEYDRRRKRRP